MTQEQIKEVANEMLNYGCWPESRFDFSNRYSRCYVFVRDQIAPLIDKWPTKHDAELVRPMECGHARTYMGFTTDSKSFCYVCKLADRDAEIARLRPARAERDAAYKRIAELEYRLTRMKDATGELDAAEERIAALEAELDQCHRERQNRQLGRYKATRANQSAETNDGK